jgi:hypothetical protein
MPEAERDLLRWMRPPQPTHSQPIPRFPFEITLELPERTEYAIGDRIAFDVTLKNISGRPVAVPWSVDGAGFAAATPGARRMVLALEFDHPVMGRQTFAWQTLFGASSVADTLRLIQPGETMLVRAEDALQLNAAWTEPVIGGWVRGVELKAIVTLAIPSESYSQGVSQNVEVEIRKQ